VAALVLVTVMMVEEFLEDWLNEMDDNEGYYILPHGLIVVY
jgi:hypothetical protein